jgi:hypothetical protein
MHASPLSATELVEVSNSRIIKKSLFRLVWDAKCVKLLVRVLPDRYRQSQSATFWLSLAEVAHA